MNLSLNEVEGLAKKAARGAGYSWGLSEEAAKAARWLCSFGHHGCAYLADLLTQVDQHLLLLSPPVLDPNNWSAQHGQLCPITAGASLADHAHLLQQAQSISLQAVAVPTLLLPFGHLISRASEQTVQITWSDGSSVMDGTSFTLTGALPAGGDDLVVSKGGSMGLMQETHTRATPTQNEWDILQSFAARTYAPATEESRQRGAGDGSTRDD